MKASRTALLIRICPVAQTVTPFRKEISPQVMQALLKSKTIANREVAFVHGKGAIRCARAHVSREVMKAYPRWQLGESPPVAGTSILFGLNFAGRAASCPVGADFIRENIKWLGPLGDQMDEEEHLEQVQANISALFTPALADGEERTHDSTSAIND